MSFSNSFDFYNVLWIIFKALKLIALRDYDFFQLTINCKSFSNTCLLVNILAGSHCYLAIKRWRSAYSGQKLFHHMHQWQVTKCKSGADGGNSWVFHNFHCNTKPWHTSGAKAAFRHRGALGCIGAWPTYQSMKQTLFLFGFSLFFSPQFVKAWNQLFTPETKRNSWGGCGLRWKFPSSHK